MLFFNWSNSNRESIELGRKFVNALFFEFSLSVNTLIKCKAMCDEITHIFQIKTFLLKFLVEERFKGWLSWPPLLVHSSVKYAPCLALKPCIPCGGCLFHSTTRLNFQVYSGVSLAFHMEGVLYHGTTRLNFFW